MLHEKWSDYTRQEIKSVKVKKCSKCPYKGHAQHFHHSSQEDAIGLLICDYISITGKRRGCRPEDCKHYKDDPAMVKAIKKKRRENVCCN